MLRFFIFISNYFTSLSSTALSYFRLHCPARMPLPLPRKNMTTPDSPFELHLTIETDNESAVPLLSEASGLSKQQIKQVMQNGAVWVSRALNQSSGAGKNTRRLRRAKKALAPGDELHMYYDSAIQATEPKTPLTIATENTYSVFFKPAGMYSQGSKWGDHCAINRWVERDLDKPAFIVHRLDKAATGLILIAHSKAMAAALAGLFQERAVEKCYRARVHGKFPDTALLFDTPIDDRDAHSTASLIKYDDQDDSSLLEVSIETGRKHQIRRHLSEAGYPIVGDRLYGSGTQSNLSTDLKLVAVSLAFICPESGEQKAFVVPRDLMPAAIAATGSN